MTVNDNDNLIINIGERTKYYSKEFVIQAIEEKEKRDEQIKIAPCSNHDRDTAEAERILPPEQDVKLTAVKHDNGKIRMELLPINAMTQIAKVFTFGAKKYDDFNYMKNGGIKASRVYGALLRHMFAWYGGESQDPETGESHLAHAGCCIMILLELEKFGTNIDKPTYYDTK